MTTVLSRQWRRWLAENLMLDHDSNVLVEIGTGDGLDADVLRREVTRMCRLPVYESGRHMAQRLRKAESLLGVYRQLAELTDPPGTVEHRTHLTGDVMLHEYYARNRPVVLLGLARSWPAYAAWTPQYLRGACGEQVVEVMTGRDSDARYEINSEAHKQPMRFADYVERVIAAESSNDCYLVANNHFLDQDGARVLLDDLRPLPEFLTANHQPGSVFLWFGPGGTVTPLHHDAMNVLLVQIMGHKKVTLIPSTQLPLVYNEIAVYSEVDLEAVDLDRYPEFAATSPVELTLNPGDAVFIPVGWWHHVRSLDLSISTSFTNFTFPNDFTWQHPHGRE